jgi:hypothetical protein
MSTHDDLALPQPEKVEVVVTDIRMPFGSMVGFMVKWSLASIPAIIIVSVIMFGLVVGATAVLSLLFGVGAVGAGLAS